MFSTKKLISKIDSFIKSSNHKLSKKEIKQLLIIRSEILKAKNDSKKNPEKKQNEILKWMLEILKIITSIKDFF